MTSLMTSRPKASGSRAILACLTTGVSPTVMASATIVRARAGRLLLENSGARMNSGLTRANTRKNAATCCSVKWARSALAFIPADRLEVDGVRDAAPQVVRPVDDRAQHPRAGDRDHRDQGQDLR